MSDKLQTVRHYVSVGLNLPPLKRFPGPARWLARLAARGVRYLSRVVTDWQREFNQAVLHALEDLDGTVTRLEQAQRAHQWQFEEKWQKYSTAVHHHQTMLEQQAASLQQQQALLQRHAALLEEHEAGLEAVQAAVEQPQDLARLVLGTGAAQMDSSRQALLRLRQELALEQRRLDLLLEQVRPLEPGATLPPALDAEEAGTCPEVDRVCASFGTHFQDSREGANGTR